MGSAVLTTAPVAVPGDHVCCVVDDADERAGRAAAWARDGIAAGERVVYVEPDAARGSFARELERHAVDWRSAAERGQLVVQGQEESLLADGAFDPERRMALHADFVRRSVADGYPAVRMGADSLRALGVVPDLDALAEYEAALERLTLAHPVSVVCFYERPSLGARLRRFVRLHPRSVADPLARFETRPGVVTLAGEIDLSNLDVLRGVLDAVEPRDGQVVLDCAALRFIDVGGAGELVGFAERLGDGAQVLVDTLPPAALRVLRLGGWGHALHIVGSEVPS